MLRTMTQTDKRQMVNYLLTDKQVSKTNIWRKICTEDTLIRHSNRKIRVFVQAIIRDLLAAGQKKHI